jgi:hypothetical protein
MYTWTGSGAAFGSPVEVPLPAAGDDWQPAMHPESTMTAADLEVAFMVSSLPFLFPLAALRPR